MNFILFHDFNRVHRTRPSTNSYGHLKDMNADQGVRMVLFAKSVAICKIAKSVAIEASQESFLKPRNS